jgi:hypothetical protein
MAAARLSLVVVYSLACWVLDLEDAGEAMGKRLFHLTPR